mgnify:CR=1 FL=1
MAGRLLSRRARIATTATLLVAAAAVAWSDDAHVAERRRTFSAKRSVLRAAFDALGKPSFDPSAVKQQFKKARDLEAGLGDSYVTALASLREIIGEEGYAKVSDPKFAFSSDLVQTRQRGIVNRADELNVDAIKDKASGAGKTGAGSDDSDDSADKDEGIGE